MYGGYLVFTPQGGGALYRVPYAGLKGDYQAIQVLNVPPVLLKGNMIQPNGATFTFVDGDNPIFSVHLNHQARRLRADVFRTSDGKSFGTAFNLQYLARSAASTDRSGFAWDGGAAKGAASKEAPVPNGTYTVVLTVTKALGTDAETETWTSPPITLARP
jgi:hypothetical protein